MVEQILRIQHTRTLYLASDSKYGIYYISKKILKMGGLCTCILIINDERQERTQLLAYNV